VGDHLFYRMPGVLGAPTAYAAAYSGSEALPANASGAPSAVDSTLAEAAAVKAPKKIELAMIDLPAPPHVLDSGTALAAAPPQVTIDDPRAITRDAVRNYHPPRARGGMAQPLQPGGR
jgi:hypothetical protein